LNPIMGFKGGAAPLQAMGKVRSISFSFFLMRIFTYHVQSPSLFNYSLNKKQEKVPWFSRYGNGGSWHTNKKINWRLYIVLKFREIYNSPRTMKNHFTISWEIHVRTRKKYFSLLQIPLITNRFQRPCVLTVAKASELPSVFRRTSGSEICEHVTTDFSAVCGHTSYGI
jgi:hypothetical protein